MKQATFSTINAIQIGLFGRTNAGKSSLMNAITSQSASLVSEQAGTTTDPVRKSMELLPLGPVVFIDTPGLDDETSLGPARIQKTHEILRSIDIAILVMDSTAGTFSSSEQQLLQDIKQRNIPYLIAVNKIDLLPVFSAGTEDAISSVQCKQNVVQHFPNLQEEQQHLVFTSTAKPYGITECKERIGAFSQQLSKPEPFIADCLSPLDKVILVIPIDHGAPKGRIILPQQQVLRELLEHGIITTVVRETELAAALKEFTPTVVITDSQAFSYVAPLVPEDVYLTSFSILMARAKGNLAAAATGALTIDQLSDHSTILISEGCTHHRQCDDIGTVKLPAMLRSYTKKQLNFIWTSGREYKDTLTSYDMIIHCGGCMLPEKEMQYRYQAAQTQQVPITNYGIAMAHMRGILQRSIQIFKTHHKIELS